MVYPEWSAAIKKSVICWKLQSVLACSHIGGFLEVKSEWKKHFSVLSICHSLHAHRLANHNRGHFYIFLCVTLLIMLINRVAKNLFNSKGLERGNEGKERTTTTCMFPSFPSLIVS